MSVQTAEDETLLKAYYANASFFYPDLTRIKDLKKKSRYRSAIHSEIINQAWRMKPDSDFAIIMDNDILLSGTENINKILELIKLNQAVVFGASYPQQNFLSKALGRKDYKPINIPNVIFAILDLSYYKKLKTICNFSALLRQSDTLYFDHSFPKELQGKMIDTGAEIYLLPIAEKKKYLTFTSINSFHPYYPGSIKHYLLGGVNSPEIYFLKGVNFFIHHFKKLSSPSFKNPSQKRKAYDSWKSKVINFNKTEYKKTPLQ